MDKKEFESVEKLYHYTNMESAKAILNNKTLLSNQLKNMNDINELYRPKFYDIGINLDDSIEEEVRKEIGKYQQISLTHDGCRMGFDIPAMWGHYADKGNGVCIILDKMKLLETISKDKRIVANAPIKYSSPSKFSPAVFLKTDVCGVIKSFSNSQLKEFFLHKTNDWSYEQEYRILLKTDTDERQKLDISNSLLGIIMHNSKSAKDKGAPLKDSEEFIELKEYINEDKILAYASFLDERNLTKARQLLSESIWSSKNYNEIIGMI